MRSEYDRRRDLCSGATSIEDIEDELHQLEIDIETLSELHSSSVTYYSSILSRQNTHQEKLKAAAWEVVECNELMKKAQELLERFERIKDLHLRNQVPLKSSTKVISHQYKEYLCGLFKKRRIAATHVMVIMIADETRSKKPYAIPVQYIPYKSIKDQYVRDVIQNLKEQMVKLDMKIVGK